MFAFFAVVGVVGGILTGDKWFFIGAILSSFFNVIMEMRA